MIKVNTWRNFFILVLSLVVIAIGLTGSRISTKRALTAQIKDHQEKVLRFTARLESTEDSAQAKFLTPTEYENLLALDREWSEREGNAIPQD